MTRQQRQADDTKQESASHATARSDGNARPSAVASQLTMLQRLAGNRAVTRSLVQRDPPTEGRTWSVTIDFPDRSERTLTVSTVEDLAAAYDGLDGQMFFAEGELMPDKEDNPHWEAWESHRDYVQMFILICESYIPDMGDETPEPHEIRDLRHAIATAERIGRNGYRDYRQRAKQAIAHAKSSLVAAQRKAQNAVRAAFLTGASEAHPHLKFLWGIANKSQGVITKLTGAIAEEGTRIHGINTIVSRTFSLVNLVTSWQSANPGTFGTAAEGIGAIRNAWSVGSTGASVAGVPLDLVTGHIGPALAEIDKMMGKLSQQLREQNDEWVRFDGRPARPGVEPGGKPMWNYMVQVMQAGSAAAVPVPSGGVYDYFDEFRERFDEFNRARAEGEDETTPADMPTQSSWVIFTEADPARLPGWIFRNRVMIWRSLYGSRPYDNAKQL